MSTPLTKEEFIARHSASFQALGFDVQFVAFIYYSFDIGYEDVIHYESEDDFVIDRVSNGQVVKEYYQVKHSKNQGAKMTNADADFWKTIDNWLELYNLSSAKEQKSFFRMGKFVIVTNKEVSNKFYASFEGLRNGDCQITDVISELTTAYKKSPSYKGTIEKLMELGQKEERLLNQFLHKIKIVKFDNFLGSLYELFLQKYQRPAQADRILKELIGKMWSDKLQGKVSCYTGEEFTRRYKGVLERVGYDEVLSLEFEEEPSLEQLNENEADKMIEQLESVEAIGARSTKEKFLLGYYLTIFFKIRSAIENFKKLQVLTNDSEERLCLSAIEQWKGIFVHHHCKIMQNETNYSPRDKVEAGSCTCYETLDKQISINGYKIDPEFSKGWYLWLSNKLKVTWHYDWFKKYILNNE